MRPTLPPPGPVLPVTTAILAALLGCRSMSKSPTSPFPRPAIPSTTGLLPVGTPEWTPLQVDPAADGITSTSTLPDLIDRLLRANPQLEAQRQRVFAEDERAPQEKSFADPILSVRWFFEEIQTRTGPQEWALGIHQQLPGFGKRHFRERAALAHADTQGAYQTHLRSKLILEVRRAWCELFYLERARAILQKNLGLIERLGEVVRTRYAVGEADFADLTRTQIEKAQVESRLVGLVDRRRPLCARMNALLARPSDAALPRPTTLPPGSGSLPTNAKLFEELERTNPALVALRLEREAAEAKSSLARIAERPDWKVGLEYIRTGDALDPLAPDAGEDPVLASLSFNLPLRSRRYRAMERETRARLRAATASLEAKTDALHAALEEELYAWREARRLVVLNQESLVPHANQLLEATETAYRSGSASFWELVDTERSRLEFELKLERARTDQALSAARLDDLLGRDASPLEGRIR
ncbi:MAG: hypothetical protein CMJ89_19565 [Planctomycetes bacterium]|nr:hypothetical protein [Planctomycetota bacterium]